MKFILFILIRLSRTINIVHRSIPRLKSRFLQVRGVFYTPRTKIYLLYLCVTKISYLKSDYFSYLKSEYILQILKVVKANKRCRYVFSLKFC